MDFRFLFVYGIASIYIILMICLNTSYSITMGTKVLNLLSKMEDILFKTCIRLFSI